MHCTNYQLCRSKSTILTVNSEKSSEAVTWHLAVIVLLGIFAVGLGKGIWSSRIDVPIVSFDCHFISFLYAPSHYQQYLRYSAALHPCVPGLKYALGRNEEPGSECVDLWDFVRTLLRTCPVITKVPTNGNEPGLQWGCRGGEASVTYAPTRANASWQYYVVSADCGFPPSTWKLQYHSNYVASQQFLHSGQACATSHGKRRRWQYDLHGIQWPPSPPARYSIFVTPEWLSFGDKTGVPIQYLCTCGQRPLQCRAGQRDDDVLRFCILVTSHEKVEEPIPRDRVCFICFSYSTCICLLDTHLSIDDAHPESCK